MAHIYTLECPFCGRKFKQVKGIFMSEVGKTVPPSRDPNAPFKCPRCHKEFTEADTGMILIPILGD